MPNEVHKRNTEWAQTRRKHGLFERELLIMNQKNDHVHTDWCPFLYISSINNQSVVRAISLTQ